MRIESQRDQGRTRWISLLGILAVCVTCLVVASSTTFARPADPLPMDTPTFAAEGEPWVDSIVEGDDDGPSNLVGGADVQSRTSEEASTVITVVEMVLKGIRLFSIGR